MIRRNAVMMSTAVVWLATLLSVFAAPAKLLAQGITPEQVVSIERVGSVTLSPDGSLVAYALSVPRGADEPPGPARNELWVVGRSGQEPRQILAAPASAGSLHWSPDGSQLGFVARLPQDEHSQVYAVPAVGGEPRLLSHSATGVMTFAWSPDGRSIAFTAREPREGEEGGEGDVENRMARGDDEQVASIGRPQVRLWVERIGGESHPVTPPTRTVRSFVWKPDGSGLALQVTETSDIDAGYMFRRIYTVSADGGTLEPLAETQGKLGDMAYSPDGEALAFVGAVSLNDPLAQSVFVVPAKRGLAVNRTPDYEGSALQVGWGDGGSIYFVAAEGTRTTLNRLDPRSGAPERVAGGGPEIFTSVAFDRRGRSFAAAVHTALHPTEVYAGDARSGRLERLTHHNPWLEGVQFAKQETIEWTGADGWRVEGVLVRPLNEVDGARYPLAILPHGGPEGISYDGWTTRALYPAQVLASRGYAVLLPNYRGSGGRGVAFAKGDHRDLGGKEFADVISGIDALAERGLIDPDRVGISGTSYGGYFSAWAATKYSGRFKAAIPFAGISNWVSFTGTTDIPYEMSIVHWDTWWFDDPGFSWDRSPLAHVNDAQTPTLIGHGMSDERVHPAQSLELYTALKIKGVETELVLYPREPHGLRERAHQLDFMQRIIEWLDKHVKGDTPATM